MIFCSRWPEQLYSRLVILFKKIGYFFSKSVKNLKKFKKIILENMNIILSAYTLIHVSLKNIILLEIFKKIIFPNFSQFLEFQWDNGDGDVGGDGENFLIGKCCENEMT